MEHKFYPRLFHPPSQSSFFLLGPRGTGKTTWIRKCLNPALSINLLKASDFLDLEDNPSLLRYKVEALPKKSWILIDEIQKIPILLDEIQDILLDHEDSYYFALTGSSARKLKRSQGNLLAGRALSKTLFPLNSKEMNFDFILDDILRFGSLPKVLRLTTAKDKIEYLHSYIRTYLKEEIQQEAAVRNLSKYNRFLRHSAILNGNMLNLSEISREVGVKRSTLENYFQILQDTLITYELPATLLKAKVKEVATPKLYYFDCGVVNTLQNILSSPLDLHTGTLFETFILNEVRSYLSYNNLNYDVEYWSAHQGGEVDLIISWPDQKIGIEIKASKKYSPQFTKHLHNLLELKKISKAYGVYWGDHSVKDKNIFFFNYKEFLKKLHQGELF